MHEIAEQEASGEVHVVYVDHDPVAAAHSFLILERDGSLDRHMAIQGDLLEYEQLWQAVLDSGRLDPAQPIGMILASVLHFVRDDTGPCTPTEALTFYRSQMAPGSLLAVSHGTYDGMSDEQKAMLQAVAKNYDDKSTAMTQERSGKVIRQFFGDWTMVDPPGLVWTGEWHGPHTDVARIEGDVTPSTARMLAGVARKPSS